MKIVHLVSGAIICVGSLASAMMAYTVVHELGRLNDVRRAQLRLRFITGLSDLPRQLNVERGLTVVALQRFSLSDTEKLKSLDDQRRITEKAFTVARERVDASVGHLPDVEQLAETLTGIKRTYAAARESYASSMVQPVAQRVEAVGAVTAPLLSINSIASRAIEEQLRSLAALDGSVFQWGGFAHLAMDLRNQGGAQTSLFLNAIAERKPLSVAQQVQFWTLQGRVDQIWSKLKPLSQVASIPEPVKLHWQKLSSATFM